MNARSGRIVMLSLAALGCGGNGAAAPDGSTDARTSTDRAVLDVTEPDPTATASAIAACTTLVWVFGGCSAPTVHECQQEYESFPTSMKADVDAYAACLRTMVSGVADASVDAASDAGCPTVDNALNRWYQHGGCEGMAAQVNTDLGAFDTCSGTAVSCTTLTSESDCSGRTGQCSWTAGACADNNATPTPCAQAAGACATVPGCSSAAFPECGGVGQSSCFFSRALPGSTAL
jgi:hypothetical protein